MFLHSHTVLQIGPSFESTSAEVTSPKGSATEMNVALELSPKKVLKLVVFFTCVERSSEIKTDNLFGLGQPNLKLPHSSPEQTT